MKKIKFSLALFLLMSISIFPSGKKVLIEVFTNSHCPLCPSAHSVVDNYAGSSAGKDKVTYIYYHMSFPYPDDQLNQHNTTDPAVRNSFYGPFGSTPRGIFNGQVQSNNYSNWNGILDGLAAEQSPFTLNLSGGIINGSLTITAKINQADQGSFDNLALFIVAVENVNYQGRNGISSHKNVMRKIFPGSSGKNFTISVNQEVQLSEVTALNTQWDTAQLGFVAFIQNVQNKTVYQSEFISYSSLISTDVENRDETIPSQPYLSQNYPNPFNPSTAIEYTIPNVETLPALRTGKHVASLQHVTLKIYNLLGQEITTLVNEYQTPGKYSVQFNAAQISNLRRSLTSGIYFYKLSSGSFSQTKKMILIK